jgi:hypothetical protein
MDFVGDQNIETKFNNSGGILMSLISEIDWGPADANEKDINFKVKFVESIYITPILTDQISFITGEKGSGKSAIRKWLMQEGVDFTYKNSIYFNQLGYKSISNSLKYISQITEIEEISIMSSYWKFILIIEAIKVFLKDNPSGKFQTKINKYLKKRMLENKKPFSIFNILLSTSHEFIKDYTSSNSIRAASAEDYELPNGTTPRILEFIKTFPFNEDDFLQLKEEFINLLVAEEKRILLCLDGFDEFRPSGVNENQSVQIIFDGLMSAISELNTIENIESKIIFKAFIPHDRYVEAKLREIDKIKFSSRSIKWTHETLQDFLFRRMRIHHDLSNKGKFGQLWREIFDAKSVKNIQYKINEEIFDYIVRHTQYRPRQLQSHLRTLADRCIDRKPTEEDIRICVAETCTGLATDFIQEYAIDHPNLDSFLRGFKGKYNVMPFLEFSKIVKEAMDRFASPLSTKDKIIRLYEISFFGVIHQFDGQRTENIGRARYIPSKKFSGLRYYCEFHYTQSSRDINLSLDPDTLICIHPIFFDLFEFKPHPEILVG